MATIGKLKVLRGFVRRDLVALPQDRPFTIGRDSRRDLPIMSRKVSRNHARIEFQNGHYVISDLNSKAGTLVNDKMITTQTLRHGDVIQIAGLRAKFLLEEEEQRGKPAAEPKPERPIIIRPKPAVAEKTPSSATLPVVSGTSPGAGASQPTPVEPLFTEKELAWVGQTIGEVRLIGAISKGQRTVVYKGIHSGKNRVVAFKMLSSWAAVNPDVVHWFIDGAKRAGEFRHEDAVTLLGGGRKRGVLFVYTTFMDGGSALERFGRAREEGLPAVKRALEALVHVTRALEYAHSQGILHLGVRPSKILYDEKRQAKLNGLGFDNGPDAPGARHSPDIDAFLAPEQRIAGKQCTLATDIFGLGATFYYMLTGRRPTLDPRGRLTSPKDVNPVVPDSICRIIEKMADPQMENRYRSYGHLLHDIRWALRGEVWPHS